MEVLGIDVGFGFTKAANEKEFVMFKSLVGEAVDIQFRSHFENDAFAENLHVTIDDKSYFVGDFAEKQSKVRQYTLDQDKLLNEFLKVLALTAAGRFSENEDPLNIVSGLPVAYYKQNNKQFSKILLGHHKIKYHKADGKTITKNIYINKLRMMPQPLGSFFNLLMDSSGKIENTDLAKQKVGVVDIGFRTTDFAVFDNLQFIERASCTMDTGISKSFTTIADKLHEKCGINIELYRLYNAVESGIIKIRGQEYNLSNIRNQAFNHAAITVANDIDRMWAEDWDMDTVILTGGGCMELAKYLEPLIVGDVIPAGNITDARLNNVQGYHKYGKYIWGESGLCSPPGKPDKGNGK